MIRQAGPADHPALEALLLRHVDKAMFPLSNLRAHGLEDRGFASDHPNATCFWFVDDVGLVALTRGGMLMPLLTEGLELGDLRKVLASRMVTGAIGPAASVRPVLAALDLADRPTLKDEDEPGFVLDLGDLLIPEHGGAVLVPATAEHRALLVDWRTAYHRESLGTPAAEAPARAATDIDGHITRGSHRILILAGKAVAMTGFNAALPEIVQIGGVYTPPALRQRGYARLAVALHLAEARTKGVSRAVLFAASDAAARAYAAIGFRPAATVTLVLFATPQEVLS